LAIGDGVSVLAELGVTFGGFSPTLMDGVNSSRKMVEQFEEIDRQRKEAKRKQRELEFARASKPKTTTDALGNTWTYVVIDGAVVRIEKCEAQNASVEFPSSIDGMPVRAIGAEVLAENRLVEEIVCSDSVESIGPCAFRLNENLRRVVLPKGVAEFQEGWVRHCPRLEELVLPGMLDEISLHVFDNRSLKRLFIGANVYKIEPGAFQNSNLEAVELASGNVFLWTDGTGIYSADKTVLFALAKPVERYEVVDGCKALAKKSCYGVESLRSITLPESVLRLEPFSLSHTGLESFSCPHSLESIGEKAFYYCKRLEEARLNDGLVEIGDSAFEESALGAIMIPASIARIGNSITARTNVVHSGPDCTFEIDPKCETLFVDGAGGLYRWESDGAHLVQLIDREMKEYAMEADAVAIDSHAFAFHDEIRRVVVPEGVKVIGKSAFRICRNLREVVLPDSVREIGEEAFLDTRLEAFRVPEQLQKLGKNALVTYGAHHGELIPSLARIEVASGNDLFYMASGILCKKTGKGSAAIIFTSSEPNVVFPEEITRVEEYAFNNARGIEYLSLNPNIDTIGSCGMTTWCWIRHIHVRLAEELEGRTEYDFFFPDTPKSLHGISLGIGGSSWVNVPAIMAQYDNCIAMARDYNAPMSSDNISAYEQVKLILGRMRDPILLTEVNRGTFVRLLRSHILDICVDIARHDDREAFNELVDRGFVNENNLDAIIDRVGRLQDAAMTAYLLEVKRMRFGQAAIDFDL
jgi:hypothetical protein